MSSLDANSSGESSVILLRNVCLSYEVAYQETYEVNKLIFILGICLAASNLVTNGFAYIVFSRYNNRSILINLLLALSLGEMLFNCFYIVNNVNEMLTLQFKLRFPSYAGAVGYSYFIVYFVAVALTGSHIFRNWIVVLISAYRFEVVCRALSTRCRVFISERRTIYICCCTGVLAILTTVPRVTERFPLFCRLTELSSDNATDVEGEGFVVAGFNDEMGTLYVKIYYSAVLFILQSGGPTLAVFVLSVFILIRLAERQRYKKTLRGGGSTQYALVVVASAAAANPAEDKSVNGSAARQQSNMRRRRERDGGHLVIALCVFFFMFEMPTFISKCGHHWLAMKVSYYIAMTANFSTLFDSASNFFVYLASNRSFRQNALALLCCKKRGRGGLGTPSVRTVTQM